MTRRQLFKSLISIPVMAVIGSQLTQDKPKAWNSTHVYRLSTTEHIDPIVLKCANELGYRAGQYANKLIVQELDDERNT